MTNIIELSASNFARLTAVSIRPDGALVQITGKNRQGKTSILHAIWTALAGRAVAPAKPIREGAEEAKIKLDIGTMVITRTFKRDKAGDITHDLKVVMADGTRVGTRPQAVIDAMLGDLTFNPLEFARLPAKEQFERVKKFVPGFNFAASDSKRKEYYDGRTVANRDHETALAQARGVLLPAGPKPKAIDTVKLLEDIGKANAANQLRAAALQRRSEKERNCVRLQNEADDLKRRALALIEEAEAITDELSMVKIPDEIDTAKLTADLASAQTVSKVRDQFELRAQYERAAEEAEAESKGYTNAIANIDKAKHDAITNAKMPVPDLSFGEEQVLLNGLPFSQAATSEKIFASVRIGMALNPELRVMLIDEGSELDSETLALMAAFAEKQKYQIWMARVDESGKVGFVIEDGTIKE